MTIMLDEIKLPEKGDVQVKIDRSFEIIVSAEEARKEVNHWLCHEVSLLIRAETHTLVLGEQVVWRVPAVFSTPGAGRVGQVGSIDVDVTTGAMNNSPEHQAEIERQAEQLAKGLPPYQPKQGVPEAYFTTNVPVAPII